MTVTAIIKGAKQIPTTRTIMTKAIMTTMPLMATSIMVTSKVEMDFMTNRK